MGEHRTRKQKEHAQIARQMAAQYSLKDISLTSGPHALRAKSLAAQRNGNAFIFHDLLKTLLMSCVILGLLALAWWRLK